MKEVVIRPQRKYHFSPLRYPGGKTSMLLVLDEVIKNNDLQDSTYIEPFAGGAGAALALLLLEKVDKIIINDLDDGIFAFWKSMLEETERFVKCIEDAELSIVEWRRQKLIHKDPGSTRFERGFATFYLNRANRSGIIDGGPIGGIKQEGKWKIDARFNKKTLIKRIQDIAMYRSRITVTNMDGLKLLEKYKNKPNIFIYLDPPYFDKGACLYLNHYKDKNHEALSSFLNSNNKMYWVLSYDNVEFIQNLYNSQRQYGLNLNYNAAVVRKAKELMVFSDAINIPGFSQQVGQKSNTE